MPETTQYIRILKNDFDRLKRATPGEQDKALRALATQGVQIVKVSMQQSPASGRVYQRGSRFHVASSPGNAPRIDTGALINSIRSAKLTGRSSGYRIIAGGQGLGIYPLVMEFGTAQTGGDDRTAPRPYMGPMAQQLEKLIPDIFDKFLENV